MAPHPRVIGLYLPMRYEVGPRIAAGVLQYIERYPDLRIHDFCSYDDAFVQEGFQPASSRPPSTGAVDGVVLYIRQLPGLFDWVQSGGVPLVNTNFETIDTPIVSVYANLDDVRLAVDHLVGLGYRRFAYIGFGDFRSSEIRRRALVEELASRNLRLHRSISIRGRRRGSMRDCNYEDLRDRASQPGIGRFDPIREETAGSDHAARR